MLAKSRVWIVAALALAPAWLASAQDGGRSLPKGEERAHFLEKVFESPIGEVEFTVLGSAKTVDGGGGERSGFLRASRGNLLSFQEARGATGCQAWFQSAKQQPLPGGCEFVFYDETSGRSLSVRSEEMEESNLFQAAKGKLRGWRSYVAL